MRRSPECIHRELTCHRPQLIRQLNASANSASPGTHQPPLSAVSGQRERASMMVGHRQTGSQTRRPLISPCKHSPRPRGAARGSARCTTSSPLPRAATALQQCSSVLCPVTHRKESELHRPRQHQPTAIRNLIQHGRHSSSRHSSYARPEDPRNLCSQAASATLFRYSSTVSIGRRPRQRCFCRPLSTAFRQKQQYCLSDDPSALTHAAAGKSRMQNNSVSRNRLTTASCV
jgi:hypothetical protein